MSTIVNRDLEISRELDREAMAALKGGFISGWFVYRRVKSAFKAGWAIGSWLDKKFDLSDRISGTGKHSR